MILASPPNTPPGAGDDTDSNESALSFAICSDEKTVRELVQKTHVLITFIISSAFQYKTNDQLVVTKF